MRLRSAFYADINRRFLRARRFVPKDALGQFKDTEHWREQNEITALYDNIDVGDYEETRRLVSRAQLSAQHYSLG
jgi:hypothetical protein